ncbi:hypothetical protein A3C37_02265 [Candidatus Peribacteria bacterium RIFCSPHIGHO2_02_FULL_53_20]|nr:MAG: hypothetical protein A3C37_02265 [Candidatus Peribacteria bacterium RIFCSPHIGHO2_02_FULL_53_20]OGJ65881.1 MAG: hypothetical protein A3B61_03910 [Candidatus Peribacteria bacterium RIFCSPLOWO2_01_FULL_53_10]OGJ69850.1 MAG: hypothetical protein A3G69_00230 [Candidatus Peribacteria bacterium RIFCSPLOWO2_12_FULL_53_10]
MGKTLSATQARKQFFKLLEEAGKSGANIKITFEGHPSLVLLSEEEYEGWLETLEIMSDPELVQDIAEGIRDMKAGRTIPLAEIERQLRL